MVEWPVTEHWMAPAEVSRDAVSTVDDSAAYVDAATVALRYNVVALSPATRSKTRTADPEPVTPRSLRDAMGCLPTGVCVVTTSWQGADLAVTANSVTSLSLDPPLILVCIDKKARFHKAITSSSSWGVSVLDASAHDISSEFARPGRAAHGQLAQIGHHRGPATGVALLDRSVAEIECTTHAIYQGGDHDIIVGRVVALAQFGESVHPLLFHRGTYRWLL